MFDVKTFNVAQFDSILSKGLSQGLGHRHTGEMCIEAAICTVLDLPHGDDPGCVAKSVRSFKISLNDRNWSSPQARAQGLRDLGLAQLGSLGVVSDVEFVFLVAKKTIQRILPPLFRSFHRAEFDLVAERCEKEGTKEAAYAANAAYMAAYAASAATNAAYMAAYAASAATNAAAYAASAATNAATNAAANAAYMAVNAAAHAAAHAAAKAVNAAATPTPDFYLLLSASIALETLRELNSPGIALLENV